MKNIRMLWSYKFTLEKNCKKIKTIYKNGYQSYEFHDTETKEYEFHQYKSPVLINDININEMLLSNKFPFW